MYIKKLDKEIAKVQQTLFCICIFSQGINRKLTQMTHQFYSHFKFKNPFFDDFV